MSNGLAKAESSAMHAAMTAGAQAAAIVPRTLGEVQAVASIAAAAGLYGVRSEADAAVRIFTGLELGLSPFQALRGIHVLNGRPVLAADLMVGVCKRSGLCERFECVESTATKATWVVRRRGESEVSRSFTVEDAKRAGLLAKSGPWQQYPQNMLRARAAANVAREVFPDLLNGLYDPDEVDNLGPAPAPASSSPAPVQRSRPRPVPQPVPRVEVAEAELAEEPQAAPEAVAEPLPTPAPDAVVDAFMEALDAITSAANLAQLRAAAQVAKRHKDVVGETEYGQLQQAYLQRQKELQQAQAAPRMREPGEEG